MLSKLADEKQETLIQRLTVRDLVFGYNDGLLDVIHQLIEFAAKEGSVIPNAVTSR